MIMIYGTHDDLVNIVDLHANAERIDALDKEVSILVGTAAAGLVVRFEYAPKRTPRNGLGGGARGRLRSTSWAPKCQSRGQLNDYAAALKWVHDVWHASVTIPAGFKMASK